MKKEGGILRILKVKLGFGTLSVLLFALGSLLMTTFKNGFCLGDVVLTSCGLPAWSNNNGGIHLTLFYCLAFFAVSVIFGYKFKSDFGAKLGKGLSLIFFSMTGLFLFFVSIFAVINKAAE